MEKIFNSKSERETFKFAKAFAKTCKKGDVVLLEGDLGVGKTVFSKGFVSAFSKADVTSPTFTIVNTYAGKTPVYHFDLYRLNSTSELLDIGVEEYFYGNGICLVEWPERAQGVYPDGAISVTITRLSENEREIVVKR